MIFVVLLYKMRKEDLIKTDGLIGFGICAFCELMTELFFLGAFLLSRT